MFDKGNYICNCRNKKLVCYWKKILGPLKVTKSWACLKQLSKKYILRNVGLQVLQTCDTVEKFQRYLNCSTFFFFFFLHNVNKACWGFNLLVSWSVKMVVRSSPLCNFKPWYVLILFSLYVKNACDLSNWCHITVHNFIWFLHYSFNKFGQHMPIGSSQEQRCWFSPPHPKFNSKKDHF